MTSERWRRIEEIYEDALQRAPNERRAFLQVACGGDENLRHDVERLIIANDKAGDFLASPAWGVEPDVLATQTVSGDRNTPLVGRQVGHYRILAPLGAGGMGEVYRAHDSTLNREVALKVLPDLFALNPDRLARFKREARVLASLNHPNIAAIYGFEDAGDIKALVLELVEGPTLADRIARGRISLEEALPIARQIAEALEAAHERGIVHRDLKPGNIKVRSDGMVKVLDFGLARALEVESSGAAATQSPTVPSPAVTADGIIVGTPAYMAPEQARGKPADKRTDLWAFGCVLYEMLTGRRAFAGEDTSETLAAVIKDEPEWRALTDETPPSIRRLLRRCLAKNPKTRLSDASAARIEIDEALNEPQLDIPAAQTTLGRRERFAWASGVMLLAMIAVAAVVWPIRPPPPAAELRFEFTTPPTTDPVSLAISPDGQKIVFVATSEGQNRLWLRTLDSGNAAPLTGTDGARFPFWSPDSRTVGFFSYTDNQLKRIDIDGRSLQALGNFPLGTGGTWGRDDTILASVAGSTPIFRISSTGGERSAVTRVEEAPQNTHQSPQFLPDGRHFLYHQPAPTPGGVYVARVDGPETQRLLDADSTPLYMSGHLLFLRQGTLFAQPFEPDRLMLTGDPFRVAEQVASQGAAPAVSVSAAGALAYRIGSAGNQVVSVTQQLVWFDRSGKELEKVGAPNTGFRPALSPDGGRVAVMQGQGGPPDIWVLTFDRGAPRRFTSNGLVDIDPVWSPDGRHIVFSSNPNGVLDLYRKPTTGDGNEELLYTSPTEDKAASDWSPNGRFLLYGSYDHQTGDNDIWALPLDRDRKPLAVVQTNFDDRNGQFSPNGQWIAYESNETGRYEVYVQPFPRGPKELISTDGGAQVRWRRDGRELFYIALDGRLMAVPIRVGPEGDIEAGLPLPLFATRVGGAVQGLGRQQYMVARDGQRFLMSTVEVSTSPISVIMNWQPRP